MSKKTTPKMSQTFPQRLSNEDHDLVIQALKNNLLIKPNDTKRDQEAKEQRMKQFEQILKTYAYRSNRVAAKLKYSDLPVLLDVADMNYRELFQNISTNPDGEYEEPTWATESEERMCFICDLLPLHKKKMVEELAYSLLPESMIQLLHDRSLTPTQKIYDYASLSASTRNQTKQKAVELGIFDALKERLRGYNYNAVRFHLLPYVAKNFDFSLYWILDFDDQHPVLAKSCDTERVMIPFCALQEDRKTLVLSAALNLR